MKTRQEPDIMDQFLDPQNDIMDQFPDPETDIVGERNLKTKQHQLYLVFSITYQISSLFCA